MEQEAKNILFEGDSEWRSRHLKRHMAFVPKGFIRHYILRLLDEKPMSGSEIIQHVEERSGGRWRPSPGSVYPLLSWLQEKRYIKEVPAQEPGIKRYTLTDGGKKFLQEHEKRRSKMEEWFKSFGPGFSFGPAWLVMPDYVKTVMKADFELHNTLWKLRHTTPDEDSEKTAQKVAEILKEATGEIAKLIKEESK